MEFAKYQALGNDYVVIDPHRVALQPSPERIRLLCDRHFGIGADGVLFGPTSPTGPTAPTAPGSATEPVEVRIFNSDGGECERSGNGLRIFALYLASHYGYGPEFVIRTVAGDTAVRLLPEAGAVSVDLGRPRFDAVAQPLAVGGDRLFVTRVHNGNRTPWSPPTSRPRSWPAGSARCW